MLSILIACCTASNVGISGGGDVIALDGHWTASTKETMLGAPLTISATVPGDLISDLAKAGIVGDPLYELNFKNASMWSAHDVAWTYSRQFAASPGATGLLVFEGVKMGSIISLNGKVLGNTTDQFLRYTFSVDLQASNTLEVEFPANAFTGCHVN